MFCGILVWFFQLFLRAEKAKPILASKQNMEKTKKCPSSWTKITAAPNPLAFKGIIFTLFLLFGALTVFSQQTPIIDWAKSIGSNATDQAQAIDKNSNGEYFVTGFSNGTDTNLPAGYGGIDILILKLNSTGTILWKTRIGAEGNDVANSVCATSDGGCIVAGYTNSTNNNFPTGYGMNDIIVIKLNSAGGVMWMKRMGGSWSDFAKSIHSTTDGGYILAGATSSLDANVPDNHGMDDIYIIKLDQNGDKVWAKCYGGTWADYAEFVEQTQDGGYFVAGYSNSIDSCMPENHGEFDSYAMKLDPSGNVIWANLYGESMYDFAYSACSTSDGGYILVGSSMSNYMNGDLEDFYIVKINSTGNVIWEKRINGSGNDVATSVLSTSNGGCVFSGYTTSSGTGFPNFHGGNDYFSMRLDENGNATWAKCYGGSNDDFANSICPAVADNQYLIAGYSSSMNGDVTGNHGLADFWIVKVNIECTPTPVSRQVNICQGNSYSYNGHVYTMTGTYHDTVHSECGCDSIIVTNLTVHSLPVVTLSGPSPVCNNSTGNIYSTESGMTNYSWTIPVGATITAGGGNMDNSVTLTWTSAGTKMIKVNYFDQYGCTAVAPKQINVMVNASPIPVITGPSTTCVNSIVTFSTTPWQTNYLWAVSPGGYIVSGKGTRVVTVKWLFPGAHWISLNYTNLSGCAAATPTVKNVAVTNCKSASAENGSESGLTNEEENFDFKIYPNPASETVTISGTILGDIKIMNAFGELILSRNNILTEKIDVSKLAPGVYFVEFKQGTLRVMKKLIIN